MNPPGAPKKGQFVFLPVLSIGIFFAFLTFFGPKCAYKRIHGLFLDTKKTVFQTTPLFWLGNPPALLESEGWSDPLGGGRVRVGFREKVGSWVCPLGIQNAKNEYMSVVLGTTAWIFLID